MEIVFHKFAGIDANVHITEILNKQDFVDVFSILKFNLHRDKHTIVASNKEAKTTLNNVRKLIEKIEGIN